MKISRLEYTYIGLVVAIFGLIVLHAPISVAFGSLLPDFDLLIKSWKEILMLLALPMGLSIITKHGLWPVILRDPAFYVLVGYVFVHLMLAMVTVDSTTSVLGGLAVDLRYVLFFSLVYMLALAMPGYRALFIRVGIIGALVVVLFGTLQLVLPADILAVIGYGPNTIAPYLTVDKNPDYIRINSTLRGPNPLGAYVTVVLAILTAAWARSRVKSHWVLAWIIGICGFITLWITYSRSAVLATTIALGIIGLVAYGRRIGRKGWLTVGVVTIAISGAFVALRESALVSNVILHENPDGGSVISSNEQHVESLQDGVLRMTQQPFGAGIGSTGSASLYSDSPVIIENQYLFIAHEAGWLGLGLFITLFIMILVRLWRGRGDWLSLGVFASGVGLGLIGLIQPVWVDDTVSIVWWGLAALVLAKGAKHGRSTK